MDKTQKYFWHPTTDTLADKQETVVIERGEGNYIYDDQGRKMLDAVAGLWCVNIGHPLAYKIAEKLIELTAEENMAKVFFTSGGSDSVETALKLSRQYWEAD